MRASVFCKFVFKLWQMALGIIKSISVFLFPNMCTNTKNQVYAYLRMSWGNEVCICQESKCWKTELSDRDNWMDIFFLHSETENSNYPSKFWPTNSILITMQILWITWPIISTEVNRSQNLTFELYIHYAVLKCNCLR